MANIEGRLNKIESLVKDDKKPGIWAIVAQRYAEDGITHEEEFHAVSVEHERTP